MAERVIPDPFGFPDWRAWAKAYESQLLSSAKGQEIQDPQPVLLAHQLGMSGGRLVERAVTDGIIMWRPDTKELVASVEGVWQPIANAKTLLEWIGANFVQSAYGGMKLPVSPTAIADLTATPQSIVLGAAYGASNDITFPGTGQIVFVHAGTYFVHVNLDLDHAATGGRLPVDARLFNVTQAIPHLTYTRDVLNGATDSSLEYVLVVSIPTAEEGDTFVLQLTAPAGNINGVSLYRYWLAAHQVSPMTVPADALADMLPNFGDYYV